MSLNAFMQKFPPAVLALADGQVFKGYSIGADGQTIGEVVFNTAMSGYQEILTDPSYAQQIITLTYPHIGNVGINSQDSEGLSIHAAGLIIRELSLVVSNWRADCSLADYLKKNNIVAIAGVDTRRLTRHLRDKGVLGGCIMTGSGEEVTKQAIEVAKAYPGLDGVDLAKVVTIKQPREWSEAVIHMPSANEQPKKVAWHVVVYDYGVKQQILRLLVEQGCRITVVPAKTTIEEILDLKPDGVLLSNGPGDPAACDYAIAATKKLLSQNMPIFGICLGFQILALACEAKTIKMKFGHHGANHPVKALDNGKVFITSQNHGFAVDESTLPSDLVITHRSLFDNTVQGIKHATKPAFAFQGHPEASPGPHDMAYLFEHFVAMMKAVKQHKHSTLKDHMSF